MKLVSPIAIDSHDAFGLVIVPRYRLRTRNAEDEMRIPAIITLAMLALLSAYQRPQDQDAERSYIELLGRDTFSVEVFRRTPDGFEGKLLIRSPVTRVAHYKASLQDDGVIERLEVEWRTPEENPEGPPPLKFSVLIEGESAIVKREGGRTPGVDTLMVPYGTLPTVGKRPLAFAIQEQAIMQAAQIGSDSVPVSLLSGQRSRLTDNAVVRVADDTVSMAFFGSPMLSAVDAHGNIVGRTGRLTTLKVEGRRTDPFDFDSLAAEFAARDARGEGMGIASPPAMAEATIAGASLSIEYSQPAKRGRKIWGGLVAWNEWWRTGANAATEFTTDRDLEIGGIAVPAGTYTLFSIFAPERAELMINTQTGQWGTQYDPTRDLARIPMTRESVADPVERFTISIETIDAGGVLQLSWDTTRFSVPIVVR